MEDEEEAFWLFSLLFLSGEHSLELSKVSVVPNLYIRFFLGGGRLATFWSPSRIAILSLTVILAALFSVINKVFLAVCFPSQTD